MAGEYTISGIIRMSAEQVANLHQFLVSPEFDRGLRPILEKLATAYRERAMNLVPKDNEAIYELGRVRGKLDMLDYLGNDLKKIISEVRKNP